MRQNLKIDMRCGVGFGRRAWRAEQVVDKSIAFPSFLLRTWHAVEVKHVFGCNLSDQSDRVLHRSTGCVLYRLLIYLTLHRLLR